MLIRARAGTFLHTNTAAGAAITPPMIRPVTVIQSTVPSVIKGCIARLTAHYYRLASPRAGAQSMSGGGQSQSFRDETIPPAILHDLARFRRFDTGWG